MSSLKAKLLPRNSSRHGLDLGGTPVSQNQVWSVLFPSIFPNNTVYRVKRVSIRRAISSQNFCLSRKRMLLLENLLFKLSSGDIRFLNKQEL